MSFELLIRKGRTKSYDLELFEEDGTTEVTVVTGDNLRIKIFRDDEDTPELDIESDNDTANGSGITFTNGSNDAILRIDQADSLGLSLGTYSMEVTLVDDSDLDKAKAGEPGILHVLPAAGGAITI